MEVMDRTEYLRKALSIWGMDKRYIENNIRYPIGIEHIIKLYEEYDGTKSELPFNEEGRIDLEKMPFVITNTKPENGAFVEAVIMMPDLSTGFLKNSFEKTKNDIVAGEKSRYATLVSATAIRMLGECSAEYYLTTSETDKIRNSNELGWIYSPNFLKNNEKLISGLDITKARDILEECKDYGMYKSDVRFSEKMLQRYLENRNFDREQIEQTRRSFIKQSVISKILENRDEANRNWSIILSNIEYKDINTGEMKTNKSVRMSPMYDLNSCFQHKYRDHERVANGSPEVDAMVKDYIGEEWFRNWLEEKVLTFDVNELYANIKKDSNIEVPEIYQKDFSNRLNRNIQKVRNVYLENCKENNKNANKTEFPEGNGER